MSNDYDFIVLGGGSAGYAAAARTAKEYTERVAVVDGGEELGGLCILRGCMPSKTLIYSAEVLHLANHGKLFGLEGGESVKMNMQALHARKKAVIGEFAEYRQEQLEDGRFDLYRSQAKFTDPNTIKLSDGKTLTADKFIISTGSVVQVPPIPGLAETPFWTSDHVLELDTLPESVIVLGGGIVACELAQFLNRAGSKITLIQRSPQILKETSPEAGKVVEQALSDEGMEVITDTKLEKIEKTDAGVRVTFTHNGKTITREAKHLFNALGRTPNTKSLALDKAGVELKQSGHITTNKFQQSTQPHIYAAGDCAGPYEIVHTAIMQGEVAAQHAFGQKVDPVDYTALTRVVFTDPQIAAVGATEAELKTKGIDYSVADYPFDDHGKSILMEAKYGYVKVMADKATGQILGAECVSKDASELIHAMSVAVQLKATAKDLLKVHWYHPTLAEIWSYPIEDVLE